MRGRLRPILLALGAIVLGGALFLVVRPGAVMVETATVTRGRFMATVDEDGRTRVRERYLVAAPLAGRLLRLPVEAGDAVTADEVVATILPSLPALIDPRTRHELEERVGAAEASIAEANAQADRAKGVREQAEADARRARTLRQTGVVAAQEFERAELAARTADRELRAAELRHHVAEHLLDQARTLLRHFDEPDAVERLEVKSPVTGLALRIIHKSEGPVAAGEPLLEVGDPADLEIAVDVLTTDAVEIRPGAPVAIEHWGGPETLQGRVRMVEPGAFTKLSALGVEEQRVWVIVDLVSPPEQWRALGDGYRVDARIVVFASEGAVLVPVSALFRRGANWTVFVVKDGIAHERRIGITRRANQTACVSSGLSPGERVVVFPPSALGDGARVLTDSANAH